MKLAKGPQAPQSTEEAKSHVSNGLLIPAAKFTAASGGIGFLIGGTTGIVRGSTPVLAGIASSIQCAGIGAAFSVTRTLVLDAVQDREAKPSTFTVASTIAGVFSGGTAGYVFRGPRNVLPGMICFGALGAGGQMVANAWTRPRTEDPSKPGILQRAAQSSWSPVSSMTDEKYAELLKEKLLRIEVEIAILDDKIAALKTEQANTQAKTQTTAKD